MKGVLSLGIAQGVVGGVEIANMHRQTEERESRLLALAEHRQEPCHLLLSAE